MKFDLDDLPTTATRDPVSIFKLIFLKTGFSGTHENVPFSIKRGQPVIQN